MRPKTMMMAAALLAAAAVSATAKSLTLTAAEARSELFGVELVGIIEGGDSAWRECIEPDGSTIYEIDGTVDRGRLIVADDGQRAWSSAMCAAARRVAALWSAERYISELKGIFRVSRRRATRLRLAHIRRCATLSRRASRGAFAP